MRFVFPVFLLAVASLFLTQEPADSNMPLPTNSASPSVVVSVGAPSDPGQRPEVPLGTGTVVGTTSNHHGFQPTSIEATPARNDPPPSEAHTPSHGYAISGGIRASDLLGVSAPPTIDAESPHSNGPALVAPLGTATNRNAIPTNPR